MKKISDDKSRKVLKTVIPESHKARNNPWARAILASKVLSSRNKNR